MGPSKNRINMHDIIAQPLGAVADAVNSVLRRPEKIDFGEVQSLFHETSFLLLRVEEALSMRNEEAGASLILLLLEGLTHSEESLQIGLTTFSMENELLKFLQSVFKLVFRDGGFPIQSSGAADVAQVVCILSESEVLKDLCGELFFDDLVRVLSNLYEDASTANRHVQTQRSVAGALINLIKGSVKNKERRSDWGFLLSCLTKTVDAFFQLQCIELLYRLSRKNYAILRNLAEQQKGDVSSTSSSNTGEILQLLHELPNDQNLLSHMLEVVKKINSGRPDILSFSLVSVTAGETLLANSTVSFFTPHFFVVLLTSSNADNISIPYSSIRSVTISKNGKVFFRLQEFPPTLEALLDSTAPDMDSIVLSMSSTTLGELKASPVRSWIIQLLQEKHRRSTTQDHADTSRKDVPSIQTNSQSLRSEKLREKERVEQNGGIGNKGDVNNEVDSQAHTISRKRAMKSTQEELSSSSLSPENLRLDGGATESVNDKRNSDLNTEVGFSSFLSHGDSLVSDAHRGELGVAASMVEKRFKQEVREITASSLSLRTGGMMSGFSVGACREEGGSRMGCLEKEMASRDAALRSLLSRVTKKMPLSEKENFLSQLQHLMAVKKERREEDNAARLSSGISTLQKLVDEFREKCQKKCDQWFSEFSVGMHQVDSEIKMVKEACSTAVDKLNEGLRQIKSSNQAVDERLGCMRLHLEQVLEKSRGMENESRSITLAECERELENQECFFVERYQQKMNLFTPPAFDT